MNQLYSPQELQAMLALLNRAPMSPAEQLFAQNFVERLVAFCQPPPPEEDHHEAPSTSTPTGRFEQGIVEEF